jgi:t-SNARE complex subunit (syntaxin)
MSEQEMNEIINGAMKVQIYFEEYQNSDEYHQKKNEELKQISKLMLQIKELMCTMNQQLYEDDEKLQSIEDCIDESIETVKKGNKELKKAAKDTVETRKIKYIATLGTTLCLLGTFWPGIGNVIGGTLGYFIGKGIAKYEKHKINKIEKKYAKEK